MSTTTTNIATPDGRTLCVESGGDPSGRPIIIHSGTPGGRLLFPPMVDEAGAHGNHHISYDRPGYGGSTPQPRRTVADCVHDVQAIAQAFAADRIAVWGISGGGPHALACAALLPDLVCAVASLAAIAPYGMPGLDYFTGMGQDNVDDIQLYLNNPPEARRQSAVDREELLQATADNFIEGFASLVSPADAAVLTGDLATYLLASMQDGVAPGEEGWWDDGVAHMAPWGFSFDAISIPVQLWHGRQDRFVPFQHGEWLAAQIPGVEAHLTDADGHLTLLAGIPGIHDWLLQHF
jgi:pimeloyl-ACP methyl ester carboxylesterase